MTETDTKKIATKKKKEDEKKKRLPRTNSRAVESIERDWSGQVSRSYTASFGGISTIQYDRRLSLGKLLPRVMKIHVGTYPDIDFPI